MEQHPDTIPERVVSLIPSVTDTFFTLGLGQRLVGVTDFCPLPEPSDAGIVRVGGPKTFSVETLLGLAPDLVIANKEENDRERVEELQQAGCLVLLSTPSSIPETLAFLRDLLRLFHVYDSRQDSIRGLEIACEKAALAAHTAPGLSIFCPVWQQKDPDMGLWWITFNRHTYCDDVLTVCGGRNVFGDRERRYPLAAEFSKVDPEPVQDRDTRYPRVGVDEVVSKAPECILLPDDPFTFTKTDIADLTNALSSTPAVRNNQVRAVDGKWITWYGTRLGEAISFLPGLIGSQVLPPPKST